MPDPTRKRKAFRPKRNPASTNVLSYPIPADDLGTLPIQARRASEGGSHIAHAQHRAPPVPVPSLARRACIPARRRPRSPPHTSPTRKRGWISYRPRSTPRPSRAGTLARASGLYSSSASPQKPSPYKPDAQARVDLIPPTLKPAPLPCRHPRSRVGLVFQLGIAPEALPIQARRASEGGSHIAHAQHRAPPVPVPSLARRACIPARHRPRSPPHTSPTRKRGWSYRHVTAP